MKKILILFIVCILSTLAYTQQFHWDGQKQGQWRFESNLPEKGYKMRNATLTAADNLTFKKNIAALAEWFHQNNSLLKNPVGYDLRGLTTWVWGDFTTLSDGEYGIPASMGFLFELFYTDGSKWKVEPPQYNFDVNAVYGGHDGFYFTPESIVDDGSRYDLSLSEKVSNALNELRKYFRVYPLKEQPCAGVDVYEAYRDGWQQNGLKTIVVYNPEQPHYWLPVTVKEMADAHLSYYSLIQKTELDRMVLKQLKQEIAELSPDELAAPAYAGHDSHFVLKVNGNKQGYQIMRFNPAYWDRSLPISAIQFMTFRNISLTKGEMEEEQTRTGHPNYPQRFVNQIKWKEVGKLIQKSK